MLPGIGDLGDLGVPVDRVTDVAEILLIWSARMGMAFADLLAAGTIPAQLGGCATAAEPNVLNGQIGMSDGVK